MSEKSSKDSCHSEPLKVSKEVEIEVPLDIDKSEQLEKIYFECNENYSCFGDKDED